MKDDPGLVDVEAEPAQPGEYRAPVALADGHFDPSAPPFFRLAPEEVELPVDLMPDEIVGLVVLYPVGKKLVRLLAAVCEPYRYLG